MEFGTFSECVATIYEMDNDSKSWEMYLTVMPHMSKKDACSFVDWKKKHIATSKHTSGMSKQEVDTAIQKSDDILKGFNPTKE